jgi:long-chain acyl-CoA synthetase
VDEAVAAANAKLERWETLKKVKIIPVEACIGNGLLTPTLKIRSEEVAKRFKSDIEALYS